MLHMSITRTLPFLVWLLSIFVVVPVLIERRSLCANLANHDKSKQELTFDKVVQPFFANHCYECHNKERKVSKLDPGMFDTAASLTRDRTKLKRILERLSAGEMPPPEMRPPQPEEVLPVIEWLAHQLGATETRNDNGNEAKQVEASSGRVTARRLNRVE